jgi:hypothetical protein
MPPTRRLLCLLLLTLAITSQGTERLPQGVRHVDVLNYPGCVELFNATTRAAIGYHVGGRVLSYRLGDREALYLNPEEAGWRNPDRKRKLVTAGRFDIGPEYLIPRRDILWSGRWHPKIIGPRAVSLTSQPDPATGVQLVREFRLADKSSHLSCRQIIRNISKETKHWCHWSRTFAQHGGVAIVPITPHSKYPNSYVMYEERGLINARPKDPNIERVGDFLLVRDVPAFPKLGFDSMTGWFAYQMRNDLLFVKRYATDTNAVYSEVAGLTVSIWYPPAEKVKAVELEPIGPRNVIPPGGKAEFTEHWSLLDNRYVREFTSDQLNRLAERVTALP